MSVLAIRKIGDSVLRTVAMPVAEEDILRAPFQKLIDDMIETMKHAGGVGLAAPQIGISQRVFVLEVEDWVVAARSKSYYGLNERIPLAVWINPEIEIIRADGIHNTEACLSVDGYMSIVERHESARISGLNREAKRTTQEVSGYHAKIVQHEIDHLNGLLYVDRVSHIYKREPSSVLGSRFEELRKK